MGCGCGKKGSVPRRPTLRPSIGPQSVRGGQAAGATPTQLRALGMQAATSASDTRHMTEERRKIMKMKREAVRKRLGK